MSTLAAFALMREHLAPAAGVISVLVLAATASAHVPMLHGVLVDLIGRSDTIVIGRVESATPAGPRLMDTAVRIDRVLGGAMAGAQLRFRGAPRFAPGARYVFFLRRAGSGYACTQSAGAIFPASPRDDQMYRRTVTGVRGALAATGPERATRLRAALLPALRARTPELRYNAALDLAALVHDAALRRDERDSLERMMSDRTLDPSVRAVLADALHEHTP